MAERDLVRVEKSAVRCPFCHEDVDVSASDWVACAGCLARHHGECWGESGRCGACGAAEPLTRGAPGVVVPAPVAEPVQGTRVEEPPASPTFERVFGAPLRLREVRTFPGEVGPEAHEDIVAAVRGVTGETGAVTQLGRTLTWRTTERRGDPMGIVVAARDGTTTLEVEERLGNTIGALFGGVGGGLGTNLLLHPVIWGLIKGWPWLVALGVVLSTLLLVLLRSAVGGIARRRRARLAELAASVEAAVGKHVRRRPPPPTPRLDPKKADA